MSPRREVAWDDVQGIMAAQEPWAGGVATWEAILARFEARRVLFSKGQHAVGYRIAAVGVLPAVLVLPRAWRLVLPPVPEAWLIRTPEA